MHPALCVQKLVQIFPIVLVQCDPYVCCCRTTDFLELAVTNWYWTNQKGIFHTILGSSNPMYGMGVKKCVVANFNCASPFVQKVYNKNTQGNSYINNRFYEPVNCPKWRLRTS